MIHIELARFHDFSGRHEPELELLAATVEVHGQCPGKTVSSKRCMLDSLHLFRDFWFFIWVLCADQLHLRLLRHVAILDRMITSDRKPWTLSRTQACAILDAAAQEAERTAVRRAVH